MIKAALSKKPTCYVTNFFLACLLCRCSTLMPAQNIAHTRGTAQTEQVEIGYETFGVLGTELPLIIVNGGPGLSHAYMMRGDVWERIARNRLVVFYDQRGTGVSKNLKPGASQAMDAQVADLEAVRKTLGLAKFALLGDSYGGLLGMAYAGSHSEHVYKLILSDSPGPSWKSIVHLLPDVFPDVQEKDAKEVQRLGPSTDAAAQASLRNHFLMIFYSPENRAAYMGHMADFGFEPAVNEAVSKATTDLDLTSKVIAFQFPTLVITGRWDMNVAPLTAWQLAHAIPGARIAVFEKSGHLPWYEESDKYLEVVTEFLAGK